MNIWVVSQLGLAQIETFCEQFRDKYSLLPPQPMYACVYVCACVHASMSVCVRECVCKVPRDWVAMSYVMAS